MAKELKGISSGRESLQTEIQNIHRQEDVSRGVALLRALHRLSCPVLVYFDPSV